MFKELLMPSVFSPEADELEENSIEPQTGFVHSIETGATADGPGIRFVVFLQGCPLRCLYCHNPDARHPLSAGTRGHGTPQTVTALMTQIRRYKPFFRASGGGVTVSGGEPLLQPGFVAELLRQCHAEGIHTAIDTSGAVRLEKAAPAIEQADLILLDLKSFDPETHRKVTGASPERIQAFAHHLAQIGKRVWVRFVLVPGLTDDPSNVEGVARFAAKLGNVERVDVLPFHKMGEEKWQRLGLPYTLTATQPPTPEHLATVLALFRRHNLNTV